MINLLPLCLKTVTWHNRIFRFSQPIFLQPELNKESQQLYVVEEPRLTLYAYAQTREQLTQEISEQIAFMWDEYVQADDATLAHDALELKQHLSRVCRCVPG